MNILKGIQNLLMFINENWCAIVIIVGLILAIAKKAKSFFSKSNDEKIETAKKQIAETMIKLVTEAEITYEDWTKAGSIKRSQVIEEIYQKYPILSKVANQEDLIKWIDSTINEALKNMRDIFAQNKTEGTPVESPSEENKIG